MGHLIGTPQGRALHLTFQNPMVSNENMYTINIIQTEQAIFRNLHLDTYMYVLRISEIKRLCFKRTVKMGIWECMEGRKVIFRLWS